MEDFDIPVWLKECHGLQRINEPVRLGIPLRRGLLAESQQVRVVSQMKQSIPSQARPLCLWPDRSIKWLLLDCFVTLGAYECTTINIIPENGINEASTSGLVAPLILHESLTAFEVDTGASLFTIPKKQFAPFSSIKLGAVEILSEHSSWTCLLDQRSNEYLPIAKQWRVEESGPLKISLLVEGSFLAQSRKPSLSFKSRLTFFAGLTAVRLEFQVRNPQAALHPGGLWDLGDAGSLFFKDLSIEFHLAGMIEKAYWYAEASDVMSFIHADDWVLYQDSSGGENWNSHNHIDRSNKLSVSFRGYRVHKRQNGCPEQLAEGNRATPGICLMTTLGRAAVTVQSFWQNFPKALRRRDNILSIGLFPGESRNGFELQGGEQKRHTVLLDFGTPQQQPVLTQLQYPVNAWVDPDWIEKTNAISYFVSQQNDPNQKYTHYIDNIIKGSNSFFNKREIIDEYGWRNFGDLYADHEAVKYSGSRSLISHYNNQYDFIYGALIHFLRTGDRSWHQLMDEAAQHTIDIDIYHTERDKAAYNHGLFWHTDHYQDAQICTHRTYSRLNSSNSNYGGGPSNEHNYTTGLLYYYYLTGASEAAEAVIELASWVLAMDDGEQTLFGLIDDGPTGGASQTTSMLYHKPGRGAGNSINALLDAYRLTTDHHYMIKAEALIQRCIHPRDDIAALRLDDPEYRWSYLVFLQVLGKYLDIKTEWCEKDYCFYYARDSFLHYANWMLKNEVPYKDVLDKVEIPTETWPAHDIRKCHIFHMAHRYGPPDQRPSFKERAEFFFERCLTDLLSFETAFLTRPLVILCVYGYTHAYFQKFQSNFSDFSSHIYDFGQPKPFIPQKVRFKSVFSRKIFVAIFEIRRLIIAKWCGFKLRRFKNIKYD